MSLNVSYICENLVNLFGNCSNGLVLLHLIDKIEPGIVQWRKVERRTTNKFKRLSNCNYFVVLCKKLKLSLIGISGSDIVDSHTYAKLILLSILGQLVRYHQFKILKNLIKTMDSSKVIHNKQQYIVGIDNIDIKVNMTKSESLELILSDQDIVNWCNVIIKKHYAKIHCDNFKMIVIKDFKDDMLSDGVYFLQLLASINCNSNDCKDDDDVYSLVNWDLVRDDDKTSNAQYAISLAWKVGVSAFLNAKDIVEIKSRMCLWFACSILQVWITCNNNCNLSNHH